MSSPHGGPTRFGVFLAPFHNDDEHPAHQLRRDLELMTHLDRLGYHEAWIGEHHSGAYEIIASPEVFIASAVERTTHLRFGTGVSSLSYHHPLILVDRMVQLDLQSLGRVMLGVGPGQLPTDAFMMGIDPVDQRRRMFESLDAMVRLLRGETVTEETDWYKLDEARLQLLPYSPDGLEIAVASTFTGSGSTLAGRHGAGLLSVAASNPHGFDALTTNWDLYEKTCAEHGHVADRRKWRVVIPLHLAETRAQAEEEVRWGVCKFVKYFAGMGGKMPSWGTDPDAALERWRGVGFGPLGSATVGTPDDAIARIDKLIEHTGGFGTFLLLAHNCADPEATWRSYELFARYVAPRYQGANRGREASLEWAGRNAARFGGRMLEAQSQAVATYQQ